MRKPTPLVLALLAALLGVALLKSRIDAVPRAKVPGGGIIYVPSGRFLKHVTFGHDALIADLLFVWSIQYYADNSIGDRFDYFEHIYGIIAELDPRWRDPYEVASLIALFDQGDPGLAMAMLDKGLARNPDQWIFPFEAAHIARTSRKDYALARAYYLKAAAVPGCPDFVKRLAADASYKAADYETAWRSWLEIYNTATDPGIRKVAENHLYQVKAAEDLAVLRSAAARFRERFGHAPAGLEELVARGFLPALPKDYDGRDYVYDPKTGEIRTAIIPWKR